MFNAGSMCMSIMWTPRICVMTTPFLIYMNDIGEIAKRDKVSQFADDTNVPNTYFDLSELIAANKLSLNKNKSCYSIFTLPVKLS